MALSCPGTTVVPDEDCPAFPRSRGGRGRTVCLGSVGDRRSYGCGDVGVDEGGRSGYDHQDRADADRRLLDDAAPSAGAVGEQLAPLLVTEPGRTGRLGMHVGSARVRRFLEGNERELTRRAADWKP